MNNSKGLKTSSPKEEGLNYRTFGSLNLANIPIAEAASIVAIK
jgi:hypothetical protein